MRVIVSADDLGLTRSVTDGILRTYDEGSLTGTSVIAGGEAFHYAIEQWRSRPRLNLTVHLNLMEGRPLFQRDDGNLLLDARGEMGLSFVALLLLSIRLRGKKRERLRGQIRDEINAQIAAVAAAAGPDWQPRIDGHQHYHMIPLVLEALLELHERWQFSYVRTTEEPLFVTQPPTMSLPSYFGPNIAKLAILRVLGANARRELDARGIPHCRWFVGLLFSGRMTIEPVRAALATLERKLASGSDGNDLVEVLLHPGRATDQDAVQWMHRPQARSFYVSPWRDRERETLCSAELRAVLKPYLSPNSAGPLP